MIFITHTTKIDGSNSGELSATPTTITNVNITGPQIYTL